MASTLTAQTRTRDKRAAVPVLLESFPIPPSFIPPPPMLAGPASLAPRAPSPSPLSPLHSPQYKQPPTAPPTSPLPPVPGPSPITEHDTLMFISAARSRRASKMSLASTSTCSHRDSIVSASGSSAPSLSPSTSATPYDSSRSIGSFSSSSSLSVPVARLSERSPAMQRRITEEDTANLTRISFEQICSFTENLTDDDEKVLDIGRRPHRYNPRDSISSIDMSEIPPLHDEDAEVLLPALRRAPSFADPVLPESSRFRRSISSSNAEQRARRFVEKELPPLPPAPPPSAPSETRSTTLLRSKSQPQTHSRRASSPDIQEILATTPRPRRKSSHGSGLRSRSNSRSVANLRRRPRDNSYAEVRSAPASRRTSAVDGVGRRTTVPAKRPSFPPESPSELAYEQTAMAEEAWDEDSFVSDYGVPFDETGTPFDVLGVEEQERLDRELDGDGSDSDSSSLDLHTPLPQLMMKDGLLSPNSKLVQASRDTTPLPGDRPGSVFSIASTVGSMMTKTGLFKDERDTAQRRVRHRDGRMLRGGIGLTTGLGWSDSEDEDAPSPLVRQLSSHALKGRASSSSLPNKSAATRSYSDHMLETCREEFGISPRVPRASLPPTSWQRPRYNSTLDRQTSTSSSRSSGSSTSAVSRAVSRTSGSSYQSPQGSSSRRGLETTSLTTKSLGHTREGRGRGLMTPSSSSSTASLATPITPADSPPEAHARYGPLGAGAKRTPAKLDINAAFDRAQRDVVVLNSPSSQPSSGQPSPALSTAAPRVLRPLRLPQSHGNLRAASGSSITSPTSYSPSSMGAPNLRPMPSLGLRQPQTARPVVGVSQSQIGTSSASPSVARSSSGSATASDGSMPAASRLKPRTGTGMVYRTSPNTPTTPRAGVQAASARPSMLRMPSSTSLRAANLKGVVGVTMS